MAYLLEIASDPDFDSPHFESQYHDYWARALLSHDWTPPEGITDPEISTTPYFRPPGYPYFLAAGYRLLGDSYWTPRALQLLLGLGSCLLLWALGRRAFGPASALGATALAAVYWVFLFFEGELMAPALLIFLLLASLFAAARWRDGYTPKRALVTGFLVGLTVLVRPNALVLPPVFLLWVLWLGWRRSWSPRRLAVPSLLFLFGTAVAILPATLRNWTVAGDRVLVTSNAGINFFIGNHQQSDGINPGIPAMAELTETRGWESFDYPLVVAGVERKVGQELLHSEVSSYFVRRALEEIRLDPSHLPGLTLRKLALLWGPAEISNNKILEVERETSNILSLSPGFADVLALALLGSLWLFLWPRAGFDKRQTKADEAKSPGEGAKELGFLFLLLLLAYTASYVPFFAAARFRLPLVPILMLFAGVALARLLALLGRRRYRPLALALLALAMLRAGTGHAWIPYEPDRPLWHFRRALAHQEKNQTEEAIGELRNTLDLAPSHGGARLLLGDLHAARGELEMAARAYQEAIARTPSSFAARNNLATALMRLGKPAEAIEQWEEALRNEPDRLTLLNNLALTLATQEDPALRDPERALALAEKANRLTGHQHPGLLRTLDTVRRAAASQNTDKGAEADLP